MVSSRRLLTLEVCDVEIDNLDLAEGGLNVSMGVNDTMGARVAFLPATGISTGYHAGSVSTLQGFQADFGLLRLRDSKDLGYKNLQAARDEKKGEGYDSTEDRALMAKKFEEKFGAPARNWQLVVCEAICLNLDCVMIAGTGEGKTIPFQLPAFRDKKYKVHVLSPSKFLQEDQVRRFRAMDIRSAAVNDDTWSPRLKRRLERRSIQAIFASPEMCLRHPDFRAYLSDATSSRQIVMVVVDEAHCISQWGGDFRKDYANIGRLRAFFSTHVPFLATSATLSPSALAEVQSALNIQGNKAFFLDLGNNRPNVAMSVQQIKSPTDYAALFPLLHTTKEKPTDKSQLKKTIAFLNSLTSAQACARYIQEQLPEHLRGYVDFLQAQRTRRTKRKIMKNFKKNETLILIATEAAGMGADIPGILFSVPVVLVVKVANDDDDGSGGLDGDGFEDEETIVEFRKKVEDALRQWTETDGCRRDVADGHFGRPSCTRKEPTVIDTAPGSPNKNGKWPVQQHPLLAEMVSDPMAAKSTPAKAKRRTTKEYFQEVKDALTAFRFQAKAKYFPPTSFTATIIFPDRILNTLASNIEISTLEALETAVKIPWPLGKWVCLGFAVRVMKMKREDRRGEGGCPERQEVEVREGSSRAGRDKNKRERERKKAEKDRLQAEKDTAKAEEQRLKAIEGRGGSETSQWVYPHSSWIQARCDDTWQISTPGIPFTPKAPSTRKSTRAPRKAKGKENRLQNAAAQVTPSSPPLPPSSPLKIKLPARPRPRPKPLPRRTAAQSMSIANDASPAVAGPELPLSSTTNASISESSSSSLPEASSSESSPHSSANDLSNARPAFHLDKNCVMDNL
ncbi:hypothetical protein NMY22_g13931 [Coprinellus aureogranulatus]|nr:hypothetical protein NMY22_g13931 [Coprinellus aureogranulatus]